MSAITDEFFDIFVEMGEAAIIALIALLVFYLFFLIFALVSYVLSSLGMYTIAKRRGIHNPWLAWIPIGNAWIMGSISDQFQYVTKGKIRNRRKWLLGINIAFAVLPMILLAVEVVLFLSLGMNDTFAYDSFGLFLIVWLACMAMMVIYCVFTYMTLYDLYYSCNPYNAVTFLLLSIFISVTQPFFVFVCRNKDLGMPPRKQPARPVVAEAPQEPEQQPFVDIEPEVEYAEPCTAEETDFADEPTEAEE